MKDKERKERFNIEVSDLKCSELFTCKYPNEICRYIEGGITGGKCDYCK